MNIIKWLSAQKSFGHMTTQKLLYIYILLSRKQKIKPTVTKHFIMINMAKKPFRYFSGHLLVCTFEIFHSTSMIWAEFSNIDNIVILLKHAWSPKNSWNYWELEHFEIRPDQIQTQLNWRKKSISKSVYKVAKYNKHSWFFLEYFIKIHQLCIFATFRSFSDWLVKSGN